MLIPSQTYTQVHIHPNTNSLWSNTTETGRCQHLMPCAEAGAGPALTLGLTQKLPCHLLWELNRRPLRELIQMSTAVLQQLLPGMAWPHYRQEDKAHREQFAFQNVTNRLKLTMVYLTVTVSHDFTWKKCLCWSADVVFWGLYLSAEQHRHLVVNLCCQYAVVFRMKH